MRYLLIFIVTFMVLGCSPNTPVASAKTNADGAPNSRLATFVESSSASLSLIKATGKNTTFATAMEDSKRVAIWFVLHSGNEPLLQTKAEQQAFATQSAKYYNQASNYIASQSEVKSKQKVGDEYLVSVIYGVDVKRLKEDLIADAITQSNEVIGAKINNPTLAVVASNNQNKIGIQSATAYLVERGFEVVEMGDNQKTNQLIKKVMMVQGSVDPLYIEALSIGADIYVVYESTIETLPQNAQKASVALKAFYTATGKQIASTTGFSPARVNTSASALLSEATNDAIDKLSGQITQSWKAGLQMGKSFKVVVNTNEALSASVDEAFYLAAGKTCQSKRTFAGKTFFEYILTCRDTPDAIALFGKLKEHYDGAGELTRTTDAGMLLVIRVENGKNDEIIWE